MTKVRKLMVSLLLLAVLTSCSTVNTSVVTTTQVVDSAMKQWAAASVAGKTTVAIDMTVVKAHDKYRQACRSAANTYIAYQQTRDSQPYVQAVATVRAAALEVCQAVALVLSDQAVAKLQSDLKNARAL